MWGFGSNNLKVGKTYKFRYQVRRGLNKRHPIRVLLSSYAPGYCVA